MTAAHGPELTLPTPEQHQVARSRCPEAAFRYKSFRFFSCSNEGNPLEAMRFHLRNSEGKEKFWLTPTDYLADSDGFDARTLRELRTVVAANKDLIERTWNAALLWQGCCDNAGHAARSLGRSVAWVLGSSLPLLHR